MSAPMGDPVWKIRIEVTAFAEADLTPVEVHRLGCITRDFALRAADMREAVKLACALAHGVRANPTVGAVDIVSITRERAHE